MKCAITGASGYIGSHLVNTFSQNGWNVLRLERAPSKKNAFFFNLENDIDINLLHEVDLLIHCAYDFENKKDKNGVNSNISGAEKLFIAAEKMKVKNIIYLSSLASNMNSLSIYSKTKSSCETIAMKYNALIVRPGMVFGDTDKGIYSMMQKWVMALPIIPLIAGESPLYACHIKDLCEFIFDNKHLSGSTVYASCFHPIKMKQLVKHFVVSSKRRRVIIPIHWSFPYFFIRILEALRLRVPFKSESIIGISESSYNKPVRNINAIYKFEFRNFF
jgi:nucleoside-diphosphate-sugar epimerase